MGKRLVLSEAVEGREPVQEMKHMDYVWVMPEPDEDGLIDVGDIQLRIVMAPVNETDPVCLVTDFKYVEVDTGRVYSAGNDAWDVIRARSTAHLGRSK